MNGRRRRTQLPTDEIDVDALVVAEETAMSALLAFLDDAEANDRVFVETVMTDGWAGTHPDPEPWSARATVVAVDLDAVLDDDDDQ